MLKAVLKAVLDSLEPGPSSVPQPPQVPPQAAPAPAPAPHLEHRLSDVESKLAQLDILVRGLPGLWKEEVDRAERAEKRVKEAIRRDRKERMESGEQLDPDPDVYEVDGDGGPESGVLPMRAAVAQPEREQRPDPEQVRAAARRAVALS